MPGKGGDESPNADDGGGAKPAGPKPRRPAQSEAERKATAEANRARMIAAAKR